MLYPAELRVQLSYGRMIWGGDITRRRSSASSSTVPERANETVLDLYFA
jgi:hypothetical protein